MNDHPTPLGGTCSARFEPSVRCLHLNQSLLQVSEYVYRGRRRSGQLGGAGHEAGLTNEHGSGGRHVLPPVAAARPRRQSGLLRHPHWIGFSLVATGVPLVRLGLVRGADGLARALDPRRRAVEVSLDELAVAARSRRPVDQSPLLSEPPFARGCYRPPSPLRRDRLGPPPPRDLVHAFRTVQ